ncbi:hypothetical protein [Burkholderia savannae]|uniref:hypothetical protein n=1 Tax=Burkholderia savannae TaxID=1637837 RepID=UPI001E2D2CF8|nr:hypothetical protein [Burkholderia savannae]
MSRRELKVTAAAVEADACEATSNAFRSFAGGARSGDAALAASGRKWSPARMPSNSAALA